MHKQPAARPFPLPRNDFFIKTNRSPNKPSYDCKPSASPAAYFHMYLCSFFFFFQLHSFIVLLTIGFVLRGSLVLAAVREAEVGLLIGNVL